MLTWFHCNSKKANFLSWLWVTCFMLWLRDVWEWRSIVSCSDSRNKLFRCKEGRKENCLRLDYSAGTHSLKQSDGGVPVSFSVVFRPRNYWAVRVWMFTVASLCRPGPHLRSIHRDRYMCVFWSFKMTYSHSYILMNDICIYTQCIPWPWTCTVWNQTPLIIIMLLFLHFRMAEPRFNNPYFWPPPPNMPSQVRNSSALSPTWR